MGVISLISILFSIVFFLTIGIIGLKTTIIRETNDKTSPYSFSRFQLWLWTLVIAPLFILHWGFSGEDATLNLTSLILLGISSGSALTSSVITSVHESTEENTKQLKKFRKTTSFWVDILIDDSGQFSITRLQQFIFTISYVVVFVSSFFASCMKDYPNFDNTAYVLMGISTGTYLVGKGMNK